MVTVSSETSSPKTTFDESQVSAFITQKGYGIKELVDSGLKTIPQRFIQPPEKRLEREKVINSSQFLGPPIDLSGLNGEKKHEIVEAICEAAKTHGFFQVVNHGVSLEIMERMKYAAYSFFNLPPEKKSIYLEEETKCPDVLYFTSFSSENENLLEWKDYFRMVYRNDEMALRFWPPDCRDAALEYLKAANKMIHQIMGAFLEGLEIESESTLNLYTESKGIIMNYYPPCPNPELTSAVGPHCDFGAFTILLQDDTGGLYVKVGDDGWVQIPPLEGALIINVGSSLEILSNGRYKSVEHQAITNTSKPRISVPLFSSPSLDTIIGPFPGLPEKDGKTVYKNLLFRDFRSYVLANSRQGRANLDFARP